MSHKKTNFRKIKLAVAISFVIDLGIICFLIIWGCTGFDAVIGRIGLRVRALFPLINEHIKLNATDNVVVADFSRAAARRAA